MNTPDTPTTTTTPRFPADSWTRAVVTALLTLAGSWQLVTQQIEAYIDTRMQEQHRQLVDYIDGRVLMLQDSLNQAAIARDTAMRRDLQEALSAQSQAMQDMAAQQRQLNKRIPKTF